MARVEKSIEVMKPVEQVYAQWTQFEEFPRFMENVEEVRQLDDMRLHWKATVAGTTREWDAKIVEQRPNELIAWKSISGDRNDGVVSFDGTNGQTRVTLSLDYEPPGGAVGAAGDKLIQATPGQIENDLKRFKKFIEEQPTATGKWSGEIKSGQVKK